MAWSVDWAVEVDGVSATDDMADYLMSITVSDKAGSASDSCRLVFDDTDGQIRLPQPGSALKVLLNRVPVFDGITDSVKASGNRGSGRSLSVSAKGFDTRGKAKEPQQLHQDDGTVGDFLTKLARKAGFTPTIDPDLGNIFRDYLVADGESFLHMGEKLARELGGTFKLRGTEAVLTKMGADYGLPLVRGLFQAGGGNVISYDIEPISTREIFKKTAVDYFDRSSGSVRREEAEAPATTEVETVNLVRTPARDKAHAKEIAEARGREVEREGGTGRVTLDLDPTAQAEGLFSLSGARDGVDGTYRIDGVTHQANRSGGSTTDLGLKQPQDGAGQDERTA
ncbi:MULTISPECIES: phage late control D family protein [unclassified Roseibium]|uniref:phage late control D family protein n=1 Tax=unclassified Roseibium TaxID=2629323 RepID=UPI00273EE0D5|nr:MULTISPECIES: late control D family protein [unclassified Roseibium]